MYKNVTYDNNIKEEGKRYKGTEFLHTFENKLILFHTRLFKSKMLIVILKGATETTKNYTDKKGRGDRNGAL